MSKDDDSEIEITNATAWQMPMQTNCDHTEKEPRTENLTHRSVYLDYLLHINSL
jgi:hypothetical protein